MGGPTPNSDSPLEMQDRSGWDGTLVAEGVVLAATLELSPMGEYAAQATVAALHDQAPRHEDTDRERILSLSTLLGGMTASQVVEGSESAYVSAGGGGGAGAGACADCRERHSLAMGAAARHRHSPVEGSMTVEISVTRSAGNPPQRACS